MTPLLRRAAIPMGALALTLGLVAPAMADTYNHRDVSHDVGRIRGGVDFHRAPHSRKYDVTHLQIVHSTDLVQISVQLRSASMKGLNWRSLGFDMRTNGHAYAGQWMDHHGEYQFFLEDNTTGKALSIGCLNTRTKGKVLSLDVDRTCLKNPSWVKVAVSVGGQAHGRVYQDNAQSRSWHHPLNEVFSPRIHAAK